MDKKTLGNILLIAGILVLLISVLADTIGLGSGTFGYR